MEFHQGFSTLAFTISEGLLYSDYGNASDDMTIKSVGVSVGLKYDLIQLYMYENTDRTISD